MSETTRKELADGVVEVEKIKPGWLLVQIGRGRYTKRFNLRYEEAAQLHAKLDEFLPSE